ncbi:oxidoreductase [Pusillimonas sp. CC-YST705]|uniref:Oxidoreductase n=1 Tax=Mesopusillimonas faecipullorum TaxID=2755040 RepID=A0ABS8CEG8_9BURK|nr:PDR/VanB family oxidoreductase [Mesopusillimonas faecipullorum]MCB5364393.1 oxidoreductase [Mesopusillimonas faecipullorum]
MRQDILFEVRITRRQWVSRTVVELVLESTGKPLPAADAGAHIDVHLPNGMVRQYSLVTPVIAGGSYRIGVRVMEDGRGGSQCVAQSLTEGDVLTIGAPRNLFELQPDAGRIVLVAGGIGITPIHAMACQLMQAGHQNWSLHYAYSRHEEAYFPSEWLLWDERVQRYEGLPARGAPGRTLDVAALVADLEKEGGGAIYCCGPNSLMDALSQQCEQKSSVRYVQETFAAPEPVASADDGAFTLVLAKSGQSIQVQADQTILDALQAAGVDAPFSCGQGICGACETAVLDGTPVHRDAILSPAEQQEGKSMMICCSRSATPTLTLDM